MGTIGVEGVYGNMRTGYTDETWAKEHHEIWYNEGNPARAHQPAAQFPPGRRT